jgi:hypothetical protein
MYGKLLQFLYIYIESMHQIKGSLSLVGQEAHATLLSQTPATAAIYIYICAVNLSPFGLERDKGWTMEWLIFSFYLLAFTLE